MAPNRCSGHSCGGFSVLAAFDHLAGTENGFILIAPDLFKDLLRHQLQLPLRDRNGITTELFGHVVLQNEGTGRVDGSHIALVAKDRRSVLQFTPVENAVGGTAAAAKFGHPQILGSSGSFTPCFSIRKAQAGNTGFADAFTFVPKGF